jgi:hypothetical protein
MVTALARIAALALAALVFAWVATARAQDSEPAPAPEPAPDPAPDLAAVEEAKEVFRKGVELFQAGDIERALELFLRSRAIYPSIQNTSNAAICLKKLERYDEALELYEQILTEFSSGLSERERASLVPAMQELRSRVGSLFVASNVAGVLVVDGRARGSLPLTVAVRVLPGKRVVRVIKDGYATFERDVTIEAEKTERIEAKLEPLANAGLLRVEVEGGAGLSVFVDGAPLGEAPWEGTLGPGQHVVWAEKGELGSAPKAVTVVQGQKAVVQLRAGPLGAPTFVEARPETASVAIAGVQVAKGSWRGRLPHGRYDLRVYEPGYIAKTVELVVDGRAERSPRQIVLEVDESHPRWPRGPEGALFIEGAAGYLLGGSLASGAEENCTTCPDAPLVHGLIAAVRGGYRFAPGISLELSLGYIRLHSSFDRVKAVAAPAPYADLTWALHDAVLIHGPFGGFGVGYRLPIGARFAFSARVLGGAMLAAASDEISAQARTGGQVAELAVSDDDPVSRAGTVFVAGQLGVAVVFGAVDVGLSLGVHAFVLDGPTLDGRRVDIQHACDHAGSGEIGCVTTHLELEGERAHGTVVLGTPQLHVGYSF